MTLVITAVLSLLIGLSLGLLGGGGSILAVPVLTYAAGLEAKEAIATSLLVVGVTAAFALIPHAKKKRVEWRTGAFFSASAMLGAYIGGYLADFFEGSTLLILFAVMMVITGLAMLRKKPKPTQDDDTRSSANEPETSNDLPVLLVIGEGLFVGGATGLVGAGGGFLVVPALVLFGGMPMHRAVATSLMVIALKSFAAFAGHAAHVDIDFLLAAIVTAAAVVGSVAGSTISDRIPAAALRKGFALFVLVMASYVVFREVGLGFAIAVFSISMSLAALVFKRARLHEAQSRAG